MEKERIVIVEDEAANAMDLKTTLTRWGYDVPAAVSSKEEALRMAEELKLDLMLMSIDHKDARDEVEATRQIRERLGIPVVYLTTLSDDVTIEIAKKTEPLGYIIKPSDEITLYSVIKMALNKKKLEVERKRVEEAEQESEIRYRSLFENMLEGWAYCKMLYQGDEPQDFIYIAVNPAFERLTGLKDIVGKRVTEVIPGIRETHPELFGAYGRVAMTGKPEKLKFFFEPLRIWLNISVYSNEKEHFSAVFENITEHKQAEDELRMHREHLEELVEKRTAELERANAELRTEIIEHKQAEEKMLESEARFRTMFEEAPLGIALIDSRSGFIYEVNRSFAEIAGRSREDLKKIDWMSITHPDDVKENLDQMARMHAGEIPGFHLNKRYLRPDGSAVWISLTDASLKEPSLHYKRHLCMIEDITERKQVEDELRMHREHLEELIEERTAELHAEIAERKRAEEQIKASLKEKEVLLKEIHHRVKNSLNMVANLLRLQAFKDPTLQKAFETSQDRIKSIALVHEKLYETTNLASIDFGNYIDSIVSNIFRSYGKKGVTFTISSSLLSLGPDKAIPLALVANELITNAFKYAFPVEGEGIITIELVDDDDSNVIMKIRDNGIGFPEDLDFRESPSLGLELVNGLVKQIDGTIEIYRDNGTTFIIRFKTTE
ncbi:MAG: PAS domain S-box protein [Candidatus Xenobiia bacterium LiM19]